MLYLGAELVIVGPLKAKRKVALMILGLQRRRQESVVNCGWCGGRGKCAEVSIAKSTLADTLMLLNFVLKMGVGVCLCGGNVNIKPWTRRVVDNFGGSKANKSLLESARCISTDRLSH